MTKILLAAVLAFLVFAYRSFAGPLEGSAWDVRVRRQSIFAFSRKDTLTFKRGLFTSADKLSSGFLPAGYSARGDEPFSTWAASLNGEDGSTLEWQGRVQGQAMEGTLFWRRKDGSVTRYSFRGKRKD